MEQKELQSCLDSSRKWIRADLEKLKTDFLKLGFHLWEVDRCGYYKEAGYETVAEFAETEFGIKKASCYNYIGLVRNYSRDGHSMFLDEKWKEYGYSQLVVMMSMNDADRKKVQPGHTISQIREIKKYGDLLASGKVRKDAMKLLEYLDVQNEEDLSGTITRCCRDWSGIHSDGFDASFSPRCIQVNTTHFTPAGFMEYVKNQNLLGSFQLTGMESGKLPDSVQTFGIVCDTRTKDTASGKECPHDTDTTAVQTSGLTFEEKYNASSSEPLADALMAILKNNIKNVDKVKALIEFLNSL